MCRTGLYQMIFGLAVLPEFQHRGVAAALLRQMIASSHTLGLAGIALTCKAEKIGYYARFGFAARGISASVHGGAVWYDMTLEKSLTTLSRADIIKARGAAALAAAGNRPA